jgi:hypothetical protein
MTTTIVVNNELALNQAIADADAANSGDFLIQLGSDITLGTDTRQAVTINATPMSAPAELYALNLKAGVTVSIDGQSHKIDGSSGGIALYRGVFVYSGVVTLTNLTIANTKAVGGTGYDGGGSGAGLGGGLYVASDTAHGAAAANVTLVH